MFPFGGLALTYSCFPCSVENSPVELAFCLLNTPSWEEEAKSCPLCLFLVTNRVFLTSMSGDPRYQYLPSESPGKHVKNLKKISGPQVLIFIFSRSGVGPENQALWVILTCPCLETTVGKPKCLKTFVSQMPLG